MSHAGDAARGGPRVAADETSAATRDHRRLASRWGAPGAALTVSHLLGAVAAFIAISIHTAGQSALGQLLPAGYSPGFGWLREHSTALVGCALVWLLAVAVVRQLGSHGVPRAAPPAALHRWLAAAEMGAIGAVAFALARPSSEFLAVAHGVLQASILLQALTTPRLEEQAPVHFLDVAERNHWPFLGGAFALAAVPLLFDPGVQRLPQYVVLDSGFERALSRTLPALLSGITALWAAAGLLGLLGAVRAVWRLVPRDSPLRPALDRLPFVLAGALTAATFVISLAPAIAWELHALDLRGTMPALVLVVALVGGVASHGVFLGLARLTPPRTSPSPVGLLALSIALVPVYPVVRWLGRGRTRAAWPGVLAAGWVASGGLATVVLFGNLFNPWFTVLSYVKWLLFKMAVVMGAGILVLTLNQLAAAPTVRGRPSPWPALLVALSLPLTLWPFRALDRYPETKAAVLQFSELAMVDASHARVVAAGLGLDRWIRLGQTPRRADVPDPWPPPWALERVAPSRLPPDFNLIVIVVDALRGDAFRSAGYHRDLTPFLDRWALDEAISFRRAYSQGSGTFSAMPFLVGGRSRLDLYGPGLHRENLYLALARAEGMQHVVAVHEFAPSALFPPDVGVIGPDRPRVAGPARSVPADAVLDWAREAIDVAAPGERFFVYAHLLDVHNDLWKKADGLDLGDAPRDLYDNNVSYVDRAIARFVHWLRARGLYDRTVIVLTSDHGEQFWEHGASLHGHTLYEEELWVPLILLAHTVRARIDDVPVVVADAVPTLLELAGYAVQPPFDDPRMGISLVPLLTGAERERYLRRDVVGRASFKRTYFLYRDWQWKLTWSAEFDLVQLFDVANDPAERRNLVQELPVLAAELERDLLAYLARVGRRLYHPVLPENLTETRGPRLLFPDRSTALSLDTLVPIFEDRAQFADRGTGH